MSDIQSSDNLGEAIVAEIAIVPLEEEGDDFETISAVENVTADVFSDVQVLPNYTAQLASDTTRSVGIIVLLGEIIHQAIEQKGLLIAFLQAATAAIWVISKQRRVSKIDLSLDGDGISIENPDTVTVQKLLDAFMAKHPDVAMNIAPSSKVRVTATVSKKVHPAGR
jgi:hypothetical protein